MVGSPLPERPRMQKLQDWLYDFLRDKTEVPPPPHSDKLAVHSLRRFLEGSDKVWETAITYTGRLVVRSGCIADDRVEITWNQWQTEHDVHIPTEQSDA